MKKFETFNYEDWDDEERPININKQGKEIIKMIDITTEEFGIEEIENFTFIKSKTGNYDAEKGFIDISCIIKRDIDGKFFEVEFTEFGYNGTDMLEQTAIEVKRKERMVYYYE